MANFLRSDLYRLVRQGLFWAFMLTLPFLVAACIAIARFVGASSDVLPTSVSLVPNMSDGGSVPLMLTLFFVLFIQSDAKQDALKSLLATPGSRRDYVVSKTVVLLIASVAYVVTTQLSMVIVGMAFSIPVVSADPLSVVLGVVGMSLVSAAYAALGFALSMLGKAPSIVMVVAVLAVLGSFDFGFMLLLQYASSVYPFLEPAFDVVRNLMLTNVASPLSAGSSISAGPELGYCMLVCIGYVAVATVASLLIMRRRDIS